MNFGRLTNKCICRLFHISRWTMSKRMKVDITTANDTDKTRNNPIRPAGSSQPRNISLPVTPTQAKNMSSNVISHPTEILRLQAPTKSESDKKEYSVIQLKNGLTALIVSDKLNLVNLEDMNTNDSSNESISGSDSSEEESGDESVKSDEEDIAEPSSQEKLAACALTIGVGSFSDPENIPGLAHFLEHMIFMGSEKYPKENEFDVYIKKKGGSDNASTECEYTTFYFDCHEPHLKGGMDIFSQLFISPLMKRDSMTKERELIESEFQMALPSDDSRLSQLLCSLAEKSNPAHKFMWGNLITLRDRVKDDELYRAVHEFRKQHYSANKMTLVVQARLPVETLESWVVECFSDIPNNNMPPDKFDTNGSPFNEKDFHKLYIVEPIKDINSLCLTWVLPSTQHQYKSKPLSYLSWVVGHEGKGSLISYLRKRMWCFSLTSSGGGDGTEENSIYSLFSITMSLTNEGIKHIEEVLSCVFMYVTMFQNEGPQKRLFEEMQMMAEISFKFFEEVPSAENVELLSENMRLYPSTDYITGSELFFEYEPKKIQSLLKNIRGDNVNITVSSKVFAANEVLDKTEQWFGTKYTVKEIPSDWVKNWTKGSICDEFHLPGENPFIPTNFEILKSPDKPETYPTRLIKDNGVELWFKQDTSFKLPHAFCCLHLVSPVSKQTPENAAMIDILINIIKQSLAEDLYPASVAELDYGFHSGEKGMMITLNGFNDKLKTLLGNLITGMMDVIRNIKPDMAMAIRDEIERSYSNASLKTGNIARDVRMAILLETYWTILDKKKASNTTLEKLNEFASRYFQELHIQCLVQGNVSEEEAIQFVEIVKTGLSCTPPSSAVPEVRVHKLPFGERQCVVRSFNLEDVNSIVTNYYQSGLGTIQESCVIEMLIMLMEEPVFDNLRTKQQLGYDVSCSLRDTFGTLGFSVTVHCQSDKNSTEFVEKCISEFLKDFAKTLKNTSQEDFKEVQESLIKLKICADNHLKEEVKRNWDEIKTESYIFDRHLREKEFIEKLTLEDVVNWFEANAGINDPASAKKMSIQVVGSSSDSNSSTERYCANSNELFFLPQQETSDKFIMNIGEFKKSLFLYPPHKTE